MIKWSTLHAVAVTVFHNLDGILDEVEANTCHYTSVCHVTNVHLCYFHVAILVFLQVERQDAMSRHVQFLAQIFDAVVTELVDAVFVQEAAESRIAGNV